MNIKNKIILGLLFLVASIFSVLATPQDSYAAGPCGTIDSGNHDDYGGATVQFYYQLVYKDGSPYGQRQPLNSSQAQGISVTISNASPGYSGGNIVKLASSGPGTQGEGVDERYKERTFTTGDSSDCPARIVLEGTRGNWGIDCDISLRGPLGLGEQPIRTTLAGGVPSGLPSAPSGYKYTSKGWTRGDGTPETVAIKNGNYYTFEYVYKLVLDDDPNGAYASWRIPQFGPAARTPDIGAVTQGSDVAFSHTIAPLELNYPVVNPPAGTQVPTGYTPGMSCNHYPVNGGRTSCQRWNNYYADKAAADSATNNADSLRQYVNIDARWVLFRSDPNLAYGIAAAGIIPGSAQSGISQGGWGFTSHNFAAISSGFQNGDTYCEYLSSGSDIGVSPMWAWFKEPRSGVYSVRYGFGEKPLSCVNVSTSWNPTAHQDISLLSSPTPGRAIGKVGPTIDGGNNRSELGWVGEQYSFHSWLTNDGGNADEQLRVRQHYKELDSGWNHDYDSVLTSPNFPAGQNMTDPKFFKNTITIRAEDAGRQACNALSWSDVDGVNSSAIDHSGSSGNACVDVPYFYHIKPPALKLTDGSAVGNTQIQQGDSITLVPTLTLPQTSDGLGPGSNDTTGRHHTNSEDLSWDIRRCTKTAGSPDQCQSMSSNHRVFEPSNTAQNVINPADSSASVEVASAAQTVGLSIGTKLCFTLTISKGSHDTGPITSSEECFTITKSPKIQVGNRDVLTGYGIPAGADDSCTTKPNSSVITTAAPTYVSSYPNKNLYGSWGEYGVFATGQITGFGSAAYDSSDSGSGKLRFSNQNNNGGYKSYGSQCTFNWFEKRGKNTSEIAGSGVKNIQINHPDNAGNQVNYKGNIDITAPDTMLVQPEDTENRTILVSILAKNTSTGLYANSANGCPTLKITMENSSNIYNDTSTPSATWCTSANSAGIIKQFSFKLDKDKYNPGKIRIEYINDASSSASDDRDIAVRWVSVARESDNTSSIVNAIDLDKSRRLANNGGSSCQNDSLSVVGGRLEFRQDNTGNNGSGWCYGLELAEADFVSPNTGTPTTNKISRLTPPPAILQPIPNWLPASNNATVIYAKNNQPTCDGNEGIINIKNNINYDITPTGGYDINQIPRVILLADCGIVIDKEVTNVDASLITRGTINTCSARQASNIPLDVTSANYALTKDDCNKPLKISGHILAKKVNLLRTYGADLTSTTGDPTRPAEDFTQNPIDFISTYRQSYQEVKLIPENETNLPPRY